MTTSERRRSIAGLGLGLWLAAVGALSEAQDVQDRLRSRLEHLPRPIALEVQGEPIFAAQALPEFYEGTVYRPAWVSETGALPRTTRLIEAILRAEREGLRPADYHLEALERLVRESASGSDSGAMTDLELLATDAFLLLGAHLVSGRVDPVSFDPEWFAIRREVDLVAALTRAVTVSTPDGELDRLVPTDPSYRALRESLATHRALLAAGGWPSVGDGPTLRPGATDPRVGAVRRRLAVTDSGSVGAAIGETAYDSSLEVAVRRFQARHGLDADGVIGAKTLAALDVTVDQRIEQIELNLERWRWLPLDLGRRHVEVNIAGFDLRARQEGAPDLAMRVAVGRSYRRTPVFSDSIRYMVLNPSWEVPPKLAVQDKLPEIRKDPSYLERQGFVVLRGWGEEQSTVDPATVDWTSLRAGNFPYRLRQKPGPLNALGLVKFMFPNRFNVYLHDTPGREVFATSERDVSSGCIRVEKPLELAEWLLGGSDRWDRAAIEAAVRTGRETVVTLDRPVPVHLLYWTAWADTEGEIHFRRDVYGRDATLAAALEAPQPSGPPAS